MGLMLVAWRGLGGWGRAGHRGSQRRIPWPLAPHRPHSVLGHTPRLHAPLGEFGKMITAELLPWLALPCASLLWTLKAPWAPAFSRKGSTPMPGPPPQLMTPRLHYLAEDSTGQCPGASLP